MTNNMMTMTPTTAMMKNTTSEEINKCPQQMKRHLKSYSKPFIL